MYRYNISKLSYATSIEFAKYFGTSSAKFQPRGKFTGFRKPNPGIHNQLNALDSEDSFQGDIDDIEDVESDFMGVDKMHRLHEMEESKYKKMVQLKMIGHKYFKPAKSPNLLTWAEKEQIRYLHNSDAEKWSFETLAQSFPASEETIQKILKSSWQPSDSARIVKHDQLVHKNWELLRNGKLDVDPHLKEHLMQFTDRTIPAHKHVLDPSAEEKWRPRPKKTEFGNIIESYKRLKGEDSVKSEEIIRERSQKDLAEPFNESYVVKNEGESYMKYGRSTLDSYRGRIETAMKKGHTPSPDVRLMIRNSDNISTSNQVHDVQSETVNAVVSEKENAEIHLAKDDFPPERIRIPHDKWKRGATFKMGDCYYDDDGSFLYRVPGMK